MVRGRRVWTVGIGVAMVFALLAVLPGTASAADDDFGWVAQIGGPASVAAQVANGVAVDAAGNVITVGYISAGDTVDFDPGPGVFELTPEGGEDPFIQKLDAAGNFVWAGILPGSNFGRAVDVAVDAGGNVYVTGTFSHSADFDPGPGVVELTSVDPVLNQDVFILKLDAGGGFVWVKQIGAEPYEAAGGIAIDASGNVIVTGSFTNTVDFDPGPGVFELDSAGTAFRSDAFVLKLDSAGDFVWATAAGGDSTDTGLDVAVDGSGNVLTTGSFTVTADFDPGAGEFELTADGGSISSPISDIFVQKLDSDGTFVWAKAMGGPGDDIGRAVAVDGAGNVATTGSFEDTADFDPGQGEAEESAGDQPGSFVAALTSSGDFSWVATETGSAGFSTTGTGVTMDSAGNTIATGSFFNAVRIRKLDSSGSPVTTVTLGANSSDSGLDVAVDAADNIVVAGVFSGTVDFDPGPGAVELTAPGVALDGFVLRLGELPPTCDGKAVTVNLNDAVPAPYTEGDDVVLGTPLADDIRSLGGDDTICGGGGDDTIRSGPGVDTVFGEAGADDIRGGGGGDTLDGGADNDTIAGQGGPDTINGGAGNDKIDGLGAKDTIDGGGGNDTISGQNGADTMVGGAGNDTIKGQTGPDTIHGDGGDDTLQGGNGNDTLFGGPGTDKCAGNLGGNDMAEAATCEQTPGVESLF